jgi:hypothetical protein
MKRRQFVRVEDLVGRRVSAPDGSIVGRLEEIRAGGEGDNHEVTEYLIGPGALLERLAVVRHVFAREPRMLIARWDQLEITASRALELRCSAADLRVERAGGGRGRRRRRGPQGLASSS